jgi:hypothetical protein
VRCRCDELACGVPVGYGRRGSRLSSRSLLSSRCLLRLGWLLEDALLLLLEETALLLLLLLAGGVASSDSQTLVVDVAPMCKSWR